MIISFLTVIAVIAILLPIALGMQLLTFLYTHRVIVSILFWLITIIFFTFVGRREAKVEERYSTYAFPASLLPPYILLFSSLKSLVSTTGLDLLFVPIMTFLLLSVAWLIGMAIWGICSKIKGKIALPITVIAEFLASYWLVSIGS